MRTLLMIAVALVPALATADERPVTFRNDVMAVLSKAGCNQGTCHGNKTGKGGFKLSLRGESPETDLDVLTRDYFNRRLNPLDPARSLILLKATATIAHEGGRRFARDSQEYRILTDWIGHGMPRDPEQTPHVEQLEVSPPEQVLVEPDDRIRLTVKARFSDGTRRDVTDLAVYDTSDRTASVAADGMVRRESMGETTVLVRFLDKQVPVRVTFVPARPDFQWHEVPANNKIDELVFSKLKLLRMNPSQLSRDEVFLRRVYLDLIGLLPPPEKVKQFLADKDPHKRSRVIDELLEHPAFADSWALKWSDLLKNEEKVLDRKGVQDFHHWIRQSIAQRKPLDQFAQELIAARGSTYQHPAANFYRAVRDPAARGEATAQVFLGVRLQCARCHNHPFDRWTQEDYYDWAGFFARIQYKIVDNRRRDKNDKHEFDGEQVVWMSRSGEVTDPRTNNSSTPQFLGTPGPKLDTDDDRLEVLADWIADPERNRQFARMQVNRIWYHLLGRGIVDPIDDFRATNPPVNEALLEYLTDRFIAAKFDLTSMVRLIANSRVYQLSAQPNETNESDEINFSHAIVHPLAAEQLLDSLMHATGVTLKFNGYPLGMRAGQIPGVRAVRERDERPSDGDQFLELFGKPPRLLTCECERSTETTLNQTFQLISGPLINRLLTRPDNRLTRLLKNGASSQQLVEDLYLSALCRPPSPAELAATTAHLDQASDRRAALEDVAWGILNAKEFLLRY